MKIKKRFYYFLPLRKLALIAATPPTNAPIIAVTRINKKDEPPRGKISAIFLERIPWFLISIDQARRAHKINTPKKPERKAFPLLIGINKAEINAASAILHQGKYKPPTKERSAVRMIATINFINF
jgi:hypothetical protein